MKIFTLILCVGFYCHAYSQGSRFAQNFEQSYSIVGESVYGGESIPYIVGNDSLGYGIEIKFLENCSENIRYSNCPILQTYVLNKEKYKKWLLIDETNRNAFNGFRSTKIKDVKLVLKGNKIGEYMGSFCIIGRRFSCKMSTNSGCILREEEDQIEFVDTTNGNKIFFKIVKE